LGLHEAEDLRVVLDYISEQGLHGPVVLCGRSMGSSAVIIYAARHLGKHPNVVGLIFDGLFESLRGLMSDLAGKQSLLLGFLTPLGIPLLRRRIQNKAHFDIDDVSPVDYAALVSVSALFFHAKSDQMFPKEHIERVFAAYNGSDKTLVEIDGDHNDFRGADFWSSTIEFLGRVWNVDTSSLLHRPKFVAQVYLLREKRKVVFFCLRVFDEGYSVCVDR
jgi:pimeloyl-ACP methyl ester carboxylesterase